MMLIGTAFLKTIDAMHFDALFHGLYGQMHIVNHGLITSLFIKFAYDHREICTNGEDAWSLIAINQAHSMWTKLSDSLVKAIEEHHDVKCSEFGKGDRAYGYIGSGSEVVQRREKIAAAYKSDYEDERDWSCWEWESEVSTITPPYSHNANA